VGIHATPRGAEQRRVRDRASEHCAPLEGGGHRPGPLRGRSMSWATFIKLHLGAIASADFFTVETVSWIGLIRYHVLFLIDIASREVEVAGLTRSPDGVWMDQIARNLLDAEDGFLVGKRYLLLDRDPLYTADFRAALERGGVGVVRLPAMSPNLNAFAEPARRKPRTARSGSRARWERGHIRAGGGGSQGEGDVSTRSRSRCRRRVAATSRSGGPRRRRMECPWRRPRGRGMRW